jgi:hypothetical protein
MTWFRAAKEKAMKKGTPVLFVCIIVLLAGLFPGIVSGADPSSQEVPTFSNKDLEKYKSPADDAPVTAAERPVEPGKTTKKDEQREKNYWCGRAQEYQKKIDRAQEKVRDVERIASEESGGQTFAESKMKKPTRRKYEKAKKDLKEAERDLQYVEEDAHRKDIPPGWLRCQFE